VHAHGLRVQPVCFASEAQGAAADAHHVVVTSRGALRPWIVRPVCGFQ
jgi:hypothetical protein